jgi:hypothetical protein
MQHMITITKSATADTRTCDFANVSKETLFAASETHINDVCRALGFFQEYIQAAASIHDYDKLEAIDWFHQDFITGFKETGWWDNHRKIHRHHLAQADGVPDDVNLMDVLEYIADCVMAGMARSGEVTPLVILPGLLEKAFENTVELMKRQVEVTTDDELKVGDFVLYAGSAYEVATVTNGGASGFIGIYDEPPGKHIDYLKRSSVTKTPKPVESSFDA